jgi:uncharacterized Zn-finger protein
MQNPSITDEPTATSEELLMFLKNINQFEDLESEAEFRKLFILETKESYKISNQIEISLLHNKFFCNEGNCKKIFKNKSRLEKHAQTHFCEKKFKCDFEACGKVYKSKENLNLHIQNKHLNVKPYKCKFCTCAFSHRNGKIYHERKCHKDKMLYECDVGGKNCLILDCKASFPTLLTFNYHIKKCHPKKGQCVYL